LPNGFYLLSITKKIKKLPSEKEKRIEFMKAFRAGLPKDKFLKNISLQVKSLCKRFPTP